MWLFYLIFNESNLLFLAFINCNRCWNRCCSVTCCISSSPLTISNTVSFSRQFAKLESSSYGNLIWYFLKKNITGKQLYNDIKTKHTVEVHLPCSAAVLTESKAFFVKLGDLPVPYLLVLTTLGVINYTLKTCFSMAKLLFVT